MRNITTPLNRQTLGVQQNTTLPTNKEHLQKIKNEIEQHISLNNNIKQKLEVLKAVQDAIDKKTSNKNSHAIYDVLTTGHLKESLDALCKKSHWGISTTRELDDLKQFLKQLRNTQTNFQKANNTQNDSLTIKFSASASKHLHERGTVLEINRLFANSLSKHYKDLPPISINPPLTKKEFEFLMKLHMEFTDGISTKQVIVHFLNTGLLDKIPHPYILQILVQNLDSATGTTLIELAKNNNIVLFSEELFNSIKENFSPQIDSADIIKYGDSYNQTIKYHIDKISIERSLDNIRTKSPQEQAKIIADIVKYATNYSSVEIFLKIPSDIFDSNNKAQCTALCENISTILSEVGEEHYTAIQQFVYATKLNTFSGLFTDAEIIKLVRDIPCKLSKPEIKLHLAMFTHLMVNPDQIMSTNRELCNTLRNFYKKSSTEYYPTAEEKASGREEVPAKKCHIDTIDNKIITAYDETYLTRLNNGTYDPGTMFSYIYKTETGFNRVPASQAILMITNYANLLETINNMGEDIKTMEEYEKQSLQNPISTPIATLHEEDKIYFEKKDEFDKVIAKLYKATAATENEQTLFICTDTKDRNVLQIR